jgi:hypothetical protein
VPLQENLCLVGIIPAMLKFAGADSSLEIRIQAAQCMSCAASQVPG